MPAVETPAVIELRQAAPNRAVETTGNKTEKRFSVTVRLENKKRNFCSIGLYNAVRLFPWQVKPYFIKACNCVVEQNKKKTYEVLAWYWSQITNLPLTCLADGTTLSFVYPGAIATPLLPFIGWIFENVIDSINIMLRGDGALFVCIFYLLDHIFVLC